MKKILSVLAIVLCLALVSACSNNNFVNTKSTIVDKDIVDNNQYYFYVTYKIDGMEGLFEATIKVSGKTEYDKYDVGDEYTFKRPAPKK